MAARRAPFRQQPARYFNKPSSTGRLARRRQGRVEAFFRSASPPQDVSHDPALERPKASIATRGHRLRRQPPLRRYPPASDRNIERPHRHGRIQLRATPKVLQRPLRRLTSPPEPLSTEGSRRLLVLAPIEGAKKALRTSRALHVQAPEPGMVRCPRAAPRRNPRSADPQVLALPARRSSRTKCEIPQTARLALDAPGADPAPQPSSRSSMRASAAWRHTDVLAPQGLHVCPRSNV